jgi:oxygen-dependent protoporphyrinogen oxidase
MKEIIIVGGGISGLSLAFFLSQRSDLLNITVLEHENRPGGKIWTEKINGYLCEKGPNGFLDNKIKTLELCRAIGLEPLRSNENAKKRFIYERGKLRKIPLSPISFISSDILSLGGKLRILLEFNAPVGPPDESVYDFVIRRLGKEPYEKLIDPMCSGIYAGDPRKMSIACCFPRIKELEQEYGSLMRGFMKLRRQRKGSGEEVSVTPGGTLTSFTEGIQAITDTLAARLGERVRIGVRVTGLSKNNSRYTVHTTEEDIECDLVVIATPAYSAAEILKEYDRGLSDTISKIDYPHVAVVCLGFKREDISHPLDGFGFLIPYKEGKKILGTLWDSSIFSNRAPEGRVLLRTMAGGAMHPDIADYDDSRLLDMILGELRSILGVKSDPEMVRIYRWDRAIPQYGLGHRKILKAIDEAMKRHPGLYITGNAYRGIGINDCVENSFLLAQKILREI